MKEKKISIQKWLTALGFSGLFFLSTSLGDRLFFTDIPSSLLVLVAVGIGSLLVQKIKSIQVFAVLTFLILLFSNRSAFPGFFSVHHHIANLSFYLLVGSYLVLVTGLLTYLWKLLILEHGATDIPLKTYIVSFFVFIPFFYFLLIGAIGRSWVPLGDYLFQHHTINIYFLDWAGYFWIWIAIAVPTTIITVTKLLHGNKEHK